MFSSRFAGLLYVAIIVLGIWSEGFVRASLVVPGDPAATAAQVVASEGLFRLSMLADVVMALCDVAVAVLLYELLRPAGPALALAATAFRLVQASIIGVNLLNQHAALSFLTNPAGADPQWMQAHAWHALQAHSVGYDMGLFFFGITCALVGWLLVRSSQAPTVMGVGVIAAGVVYLIGSGLRLVAPDVSEVFAPAYLVPLIAESALAGWLLLGGASAIPAMTAKRPYGAAEATPA